MTKPTSQTVWIYAVGGRSFSDRVVVIKTATGVFDYEIWTRNDAPVCDASVAHYALSLCYSRDNGGGFRGRLAAVNDAKNRRFFSTTLELTTATTVEESFDLMSLKWKQPRS